MERGRGHVHVKCGSQREGEPNKEDIRVHAVFPTELISNRVLHEQLII